jgi:hypothetical protein
MATSRSAAGWSNRTTPQMTVVAAPAVAQDFVPVAHLLARQIEEPRATHSRLARQPMPGTVRHERKVARLQHAILEALHIQDAPA